ncbi:hypothetical protein AM587_10005539 [Phytophthora nicotianae]|uniref:Uncharacterized protein n=1 Tax=Phytophthora nicotianae TaxID=4792 RepID=A0A0W8CM27_PHYNI|nr:hypothetical protein AM587_10005539 [Phytophthora nicotianae]
MVHRVEPLEYPRRPEQVSVFTRIKRKLSDCWHQSHIGHRSQYSIERLLAFRDYHQRTSIARVICVCVLTPIPALLTAFSLDCIPLKPPADGWQVNYAVWIRLFLGLFSATVGVAFQVRAVIEPDTLSMTGVAAIALGTAMCSVSTLLGLAVIWRFPTPFGYILNIGPYVLFLSTFTILVIGPRVLQRSPVLREQINSQLLIIVSQGVVVGCFTIFSAVFNLLSGTQQTIFILVMPLIKFVTKQNIANVAESYHEYVGPVVVFSVDLFNVFYASICMQASKSIMTTVIIMAADSFHLMLALQAIFHQTRNTATLPKPKSQSFIQELLSLMEKDVEVHPCGRRARLLAPFPLPLSDESRQVVMRFTRTGTFTNDTVINRRRSTKRNPGTNNSTNTATQNNQTAPSSAMVPLGPLASNTQDNNDTTKATSRDIIVDGLHTLFHSEYILLAEYIEFIIPMLYAPYLVALFHLPIAAYYPSTASMTLHKLKHTVTSFLIYGTIEFAAFVALVVVLKRKFGFSPLYQLAFVLETHMFAVQGHLFVWTITILHLTLAHYGL